MMAWRTVFDDYFRVADHTPQNLTPDAKGTSSDILLFRLFSTDICNSGWDLGRTSRDALGGARS